MSTGISLRAFARQMGVTHQAVRKARDAGRIPVNRDGTVDPVKAHHAWRNNTLHTKRHVGRPRFSAVGVDNSGISAEWLRARTAREAVQARLLQLELDTGCGLLLYADEVRREAFTIARRVRDQLLALPRRLGPEICALSPEEATRVLQVEVDRICNEMDGAIAASRKPAL